jgi:hypothetical protein
VSLFVHSGALRAVISLTPCPSYPWGKNCRYPLNRTLGGPQSQSGCFAESTDLRRPSLGLVPPPPPKYQYNDKYCMIYPACHRKYRQRQTYHWQNESCTVTNLQRILQSNSTAAASLHDMIQLASVLDLTGLCYISTLCA